MTEPLIAVVADVDGVRLTAVGSPVGIVTPGGTRSVEPPVVFESAASCAVVPLKRFMSTFPEMPLTVPLLVRCQKVQVGHPPGTRGVVTP